MRRRLAFECFRTIELIFKIVINIYILVSNLIFLGVYEENLIVENATHSCRKKMRIVSLLSINIIIVNSVVSTCGVWLFFFFVLLRCKHVVCYYVNSSCCKQKKKKTDYSSLNEFIEILSPINWYIAYCFNVHTA